MVPMNAANGDFHELDLEKLAHLRAKNALWRSWSIEGLSEAAREEDESVTMSTGVGKRHSLKSSPKAWEVFYERFLLDIGDTNLALELSRRHHGAPDVVPTVSDPHEVAEVEGAVRGGQLFGHLAGSGAGGGSAGSGGHGSGDDGSDHFVGMMRADSGGSELPFGMELSGSCDQHTYRRRLRSSSVGSVDNAATSHWGNDQDSDGDNETNAININHHRLSDPILREGLGDSGTAGRLNLLRTFTQARNQRRLDVPDDTVSAFLGDDLSVHHNNYFGASWGARSGGVAGGGGTSFDIIGVGAAGGGNQEQVAYGRQQRHQQPQTHGATAQPGEHGDGDGLRGGSRDSLSQKTRKSLGDLRGAAAAASAPAEGFQKAPRQDKREDSAGALASLLAGGGQGNRGDAIFNNADAGIPASTHESTTEPKDSDSPGGESTERPETGASGAAASPANSSSGDLPGSTNSPHFLRDALEKQVRQQAARVHGPGKRAPPPRLQAGEATTGGMAGMRRYPAAVGGGGAGAGLGGIGAKSTSALDKLVQEQDRGQAVMMPLMNWDHWTPDRLHWTFPAVVHAFPRCLYDVADTVERPRRPTGGAGSKGVLTRGVNPTEADTGAGAVVVSGSPAAGAQRSSGVPEVEGDCETGGCEEDAAGLSRGNDRDNAQGKEAPRRIRQQSQQHTPQEQLQQELEGTEQEDEAEIKEADASTEVHPATAAAAAAAAAGGPSSLPSPFQPFTLGEVYIRTAPASDLAPAGVGAGPWRRRWLVLRQTYVFELVEPPAPSMLSWGSDPPAGVAIPSPTSLCPRTNVAAAGGAVVGVSQNRAAMVGPDGGERGGEQGQGQGEGGDGGDGDDGESSRRKARRIDRVSEDGRAQEQEQQPRQQSGVAGRRREQNGSERYVAPVGFMCLSKASVGYGGINWGPKTLLLRCQSRPADMSREEASVGCGGGDASVRAGRRGKEIRVELRVPSEEVGERWTTLFRDRAALEISSLFEPSPGDGPDDSPGDGDAGDYAEGVSSNTSDSGGGGEVTMKSDTGFSVLGTGRFSRVVWARRRQPWARVGTNVCAIKIVDKQAFWSRVRSGKERVDTLAREVFCQTTLTIRGADEDSEDAMYPNADALSASPEDRSGEPSSPRRPSGAEAASAGGGIVRVHSVFETASDLVLEMDLMSRTDLFDRLLELNCAFTERETAGMAHNLLLAIDKCNRLGFCHRDVKLSNLLYPGPASSHGPECVLLADFGMATTAGRDGLVRGRCGTSGYVAPEILKAGKQEGYGMNVDVFSAGVVLYVCLCGYEPFFGVTEKDLIAANREAVFVFPAAEWEEVSDGAKDLIRKMMEPNPSKRITPQDALRHPWIVQHQKRLP